MSECVRAWVISWPCESQSCDKKSLGVFLCETFRSRFFPLRSKGSRFTLEVWGVRVCSLDIAQPSTTVRKRPQPPATIRNRSQLFAAVRVRPLWPCLWGVLQKWLLLDVSNVAQPRFVWQAQHVSKRAKNLSV